MNSDVTQNFTINYAKRYYYFVAFSINNDISSEEVLKGFGIKRSGKSYEQFSNKSFTIHKNTITSDIRYYYGVGDEEREVAPFEYDVFGIVVNSLNAVIVGYPFKILASITIDKAIKTNKILQKGKFYKPILERYVKLSENTVFRDEVFSSVISGIDLGFTDNGRKIGSMSLGGTDPMSTDIYTQTFSPLIATDNHPLRKCKFTCSLHINQVGLPTSKAQIQADRFGNLRLYIHDTGRGLFTLPFLLQLLKREKCLLTTTINPISRSENEDGM